MAMKKKKAVSGAECCGPSKPYVPVEDRKSGPFDSYDVSESLRTLARADKIRANSALMKEVRKEAQKQIDAAKAASSIVNKS